VIQKTAVSGGKKWLNSVYILKIDKDRAKMVFLCIIYRVKTPGCLGLSNWKDGVAINWDGVDLWRSEVQLGDIKFEVFIRLQLEMLRKQLATYIWE